MNTSILETTDIFRGAFFLCKGGKLADVKVKEDKRKIVSFLIEGEGIHQLDLDYRNGLAVVNPLLFRETLNHLRDILFNKLRGNNGRLRNDRERNDRDHQNRH